MRWCGRLCCCRSFGSVRVVVVVVVVMVLMNKTIGMMIRSTHTHTRAQREKDRVGVRIESCSNGQCGKTGDIVECRGTEWE